jgi:aminomethyltransferase
MALPMPINSPFHSRTSSLCTSLFWKEWAGYHAVRSYDTCHENEYFSLRHAATLLDVTPLYKYDVRGPDAGKFLSRICVKSVEKMRIDRVTYLCWCDDDGKVLDDGTVSRLAEDHYRVTAADPALAWFCRFADRYRVTIEDTTEQIAALALQGPQSRSILESIAQADVTGLKFFRATEGKIDRAPVRISRTGYTGDLGYEIWMDREHALDVWDALMTAGRDWRLEPMGLDALDVARVEAGFVMNGVDYFSANHCLVDSRKSSPFEIGLGGLVKLDRGSFVGQDALAREKARGPGVVLAGLSIDWDEYEALFADAGLPPEVTSGAWRSPVPVFDGSGRQVGYATSGAWSPILKKNLALATVQAPYGSLGSRLQIEVTVEFHRQKVSATVVPTPFFDPPRKRS